MLGKIRNKLMYWKIYINRTTNYINIISSGMILFLFLSKLKDIGIIQFDLGKYYFWIFVLGFVVLLILGWFEIKILKGIQEEGQIGFDLSPPMVDMKNKLDYLYEKSKEIK